MGQNPFDLPFLAGPAAKRCISTGPLVRKGCGVPESLTPADAAVARNELRPMYAGSYGHEQQDAQLCAAWGFDLLKYDKCSYQAKDNSSSEQQKPYRIMGTILAGLDRDFIFNLSQYGDGEVWSWGREVGEHFWRTTGDLGWGPRGVYSLWDNIYHDLDKPRDTAKRAGPGGWNDPDNLLIGYIAYGPSDALQPSADLRFMPAPLTPDEQYTYMTLWSLEAAPLILGSDLTKLDRFTLSLLTNDEVIDVDQDPLGKQATRVFNSGGLSVWAKDLEDGSKAVGHNRRVIAEHPEKRE